MSIWESLDPVKARWLVKKNPWKAIADTLEARKELSPEMHIESGKAVADPSNLKDQNPNVTRFLEEAGLVTSRVKGSGGTDPKTSLHKIVLDIDMPAALVPSTTEGHYHLYIDHQLTWAEYEELLHALSVARVIQTGYYQFSAARGYTAVRTPWTKKAKNWFRNEDKAPPEEERVQADSIRIEDWL